MPSPKTMRTILLTALQARLVLSGHQPDDYPLTKRTCVVQPAPEGGDSAPAIIQAFADCGHNEGGAINSSTTSTTNSGNRGKVVFTNETYTVRSVMNTTGLRDVDVELHGTLVWDTDIQYWLGHSLPVGYQNQSSAWLFGGEGLRLDGFGHGTLDGNGQVWYTFINGTNNYPGRPHQITFTGLKDSVIKGVRFVQSQMWTMTVIHSNNVLLEDIYVNSTDVNQDVNFGFSSLNTDGADTIYADNITFRNWTVDNGDDSIAIKANSTNILIEDCQFYTGLGLAIGSIGQYDGVFEIIQNITARNITINKSMRYGAYIKTWTGHSTGYPPNGGGGGLGHAANITLEGFRLDGAAGVLAVTQCTSYNSAAGGCDTSLFGVRDVRALGWSGTAASDVVAELQCSAASPCGGFVIEGVDIVDSVNGTRPGSYLCDSVVDPVGFNCTGPPWGENNR